MGSHHIDDDIQRKLPKDRLLCNYRVPASSLNRTRISAPVGEHRVLGDGNTGPRRSSHAPPTNLFSFQNKEIFLDRGVLQATHRWLCLGLFQRQRVIMLPPRWETAMSDEPCGTVQPMAPSPLDLEPQCVWMKVGNDLPAGEDILVWSGEKPVVGTLLVEREPDGRDTRSFIDVLGNEILPWPTYWMRIPRPPHI
jgi:hypothetical protein